MMRTPYLCPRTRRVAQPHEPTARRTPPPTPDPFARELGRRARPRRRRKLAAPTDWRGESLPPV